MKANADIKAQTQALPPPPRSRAAPRLLPWVSQGAATAQLPPKGTGGGAGQCGWDQQPQKPIWHSVCSNKLRQSRRQLYKPCRQSKAASSTSYEMGNGRDANQRMCPREIWFCSICSTWKAQKAETICCEYKEHVLMLSEAKKKNLVQQRAT